MGSNSNQRYLKLLLIVFACLILLSSCWVLQVSGAVSSTIQTVDASGKMGSYLCLALDSKGNPGISYYDFTNCNLKYAHWNGVNWDGQTVDGSFFCGLHTSLAFDANDHPYISYDGQNSLMCAHWTGSKWDTQMVDVTGSFTSIAIDANGYPHISYYSVWEVSDLKYASWTGSAWSLQTIDSNGNIGEFTSLKLDSAGYPHISYLDISNLDLKVAWQLKYGGQFFSSNNATYYPTQSQVLTLKVQQEPAFPSPSPSPSPMPTPTYTTTQPTPTPTSLPTQNPTTVPAITTNGTIVNLAINGNIISNQMTNISLATNQSAKTTILSFTVQGKSGTIGFSNMTIPKNNLLNETTPIIYIDNHPAQNQGYTQDSDNYYVWYTTTFSIHQISIQFTPFSHPTPTSSNQHGILLTELFYGVIYGLAIAGTVIAIVSSTILVRKKGKY